MGTETPRSSPRPPILRVASSIRETAQRCWRIFTPVALRAPIWKLRCRLWPVEAKHASELQFWHSQWEGEGQHFGNDHFEKLMLAMAGEESPDFLAGQIVADFGCGPRGSLCWARPARLRIGIDILADRYARFGIAAHDMCYVCSTEQSIPLPSGYVEVLFTLNAMDHVADFETICREVLRILAPGGELIGSFNLDQPATVTEPQVLTEERVNRCLLDHLEVRSRRTAVSSPEEDAGYRHFFDGSPASTAGPRFMWVRARKPGSRGK